MSPDQARANSFVLVINAASGSNDCAETRHRVVERLTAAGRAHEFITIEDPARTEHYAKLAASQARDSGATLVAVGGDGTINAVASAALEAGVPLAVLPQGTFNLFGRNHGIPETIDGAIDVLLHGRFKPVQLARVNDIVFIVNASVGLYPQVLEDREAWKKRFGRSRLIAFWAGLLTMLRGYRSLQLDIDDDDGNSRSIRTPTLVVANNDLQLERIGIHEPEALENGWLVAITIKHVGKWQMIGLMLRGALGSFGDAERVETFRFRKMTVGSNKRRRRYKIAVDGELTHADAPMIFEALPDALQLLLPVDETAAE